MKSFETLKKRTDFLRVAKGLKVVTPSIILQAARSLCEQNNFARVGFTATKKIGKAHIRNKSKRRMRALVNKFFPQNTLPNAEYVLVSRAITAECTFAILEKDFKYALNKINKLMEQDVKSN